MKKCAVIKDKASELFHPLQFGVACTAGSEKIIHGLRKCIEDHWDDEDFVVLKVDMNNSFNFVSRQAILDEFASFPELFAWYTFNPLGIVCHQNQGFNKGTHLALYFLHSCSKESSLQLMSMSNAFRCFSMHGS